MLTFSAMLLITLLIFHAFLRTLSRAVGANGTFVHWVCGSVSSAMGSLIRLNTFKSSPGFFNSCLTICTWEGSYRIFIIYFLDKDDRERSRLDEMVDLLDLFLPGNPQPASCA